MTQPADHGKKQLRLQSVLRAHRPDAGAPASSSTSGPTAAELISAVCQSVGERDFQRWFQNRSRFEAISDQLVVHVANPFISSWMMKRFRAQLTSAAVSVLGLSAGFVVHVDPTLSAQDDPAAPPAATLSTKTDEPSKPETPPQSRARAATNSPAPAAWESTRRRFRSFQSFVSGSCNELALLGSQQVCRTPGEQYNPLYIHGGTGVGKTHLLEAIYCEIRRNQPDLNVLFLTSESFTNYFTVALASRSVPSFRQRFRNVDVLLIDNIEFLGNKKATQEEFLHTIDQLLHNGGQLVLTGDRHPRLLTQHREELTTRFVEGLVCRIESPSEETRRKLVESLAVPHRESLSTGAINYIISHGGRNARELHGAVNSLVGQAKLKRRRVTTSEARSLLGEMHDECQHLVRIDDVERIVCDAFGISVKDMRSPTRRKAISCPRSIAMYVARRLTKAAWREIGQYFGGRDHSTVVAAAKRVDAWIKDRAIADVPNSCRGTTWVEVVQEIEDRLLAP